MRTALWAGLFAVLVAGCVPLDQYGVRPKLVKFPGQSLVELTSTKEDGRISMDTCICFFPDGSFEFEVEAGDFRDLGEAALSGAIGGVEVSRPGKFPPDVFAGVSFRAISGGTQVYSYSNQSAPGTHGSAFFSGTRRVHIRVERDEFGLLSYSARPTPAVAWTAIGTTNMAGSTDRLALTYGLFNAPKKAQIGFGNLHVGRIGSLPAMPPPELSLEFASYSTLADLYDEYDALEDFLYENADIPPEFLGGLDEDLADLDEILGIIDLIEAAGKRPTRESKMRAAANKEAKLLRKAAGLIRDGKEKKALAPIADAIKAHLGLIGTLRSGG